MFMQDNEPHSKMEAENSNGMASAKSLTKLGWQYLQNPKFLQSSLHCILTKS